jgi:hypothetical protein
MHEKQGEIIFHGYIGTNSSLYTVLVSSVYTHVHIWQVHVIPALGSWRQEGWEFEASLGKVRETLNQETKGCECSSIVMHLPSIFKAVDSTPSTAHKYIHMYITIYIFIHLYTYKHINDIIHHFLL